MLVKEIMSPNAVSVTPEMPVPELARLLVERGITGVPVTQDGRLVGVVSLHDVAGHYRTAAGPGPSVAARPYYYRELCAEPELDVELLLRERTSLRVGDIMARALYTLDETASVESAVELMTRAHIHRVVVSCATGSLGILTTTDLMRLVPSLLKHVKGHPAPAGCHAEWGVARLDGL